MRAWNSRINCEYCGKEIEKAHKKRDNGLCTLCDNKLTKVTDSAMAHQLVNKELGEEVYRLKTVPTDLYLDLYTLKEIIRLGL